MRILQKNNNINNSLRDGYDAHALPTLKLKSSVILHGARLDFSTSSDKLWDLHELYMSYLLNSDRKHNSMLFFQRIIENPDLLHCSMGCGCGQKIEIESWKEFFIC